MVSKRQHYNIHATDLSLSVSDRSIRLQMRNLSYKSKSWLQMTVSLENFVSNKNPGRPDWRSLP
jgi:hypothetical protein